jgi:membrane protease YdiL (CAAX protease family)
MRQSITTLVNRINAPEKPSVPWTWRLAAVLIAAYVVVFFAVLLFTTSSADRSFDEPEPEVLAWASLMSGILMLFLTYQYTATAFFRAKDDHRAPENLTLQQAIRLGDSINTPLPIVLMLAFAAAIVIDLIRRLIGISELSLPIPLYGVDQDNTVIFAAAVLVTVLLRPLVEELIFRGILYPALIKFRPPMEAIVINAILFAVMHFILDPEFVWWGFVLPLIIGVCAGMARASTQSVLAAIGTHAMFGLFLVLRATL